MSVGIRTNAKSDERAVVGENDAGSSCRSNVETRTVVDSCHVFRVSFTVSGILLYSTGVKSIHTSESSAIRLLLVPSNTGDHMIPNCSVFSIMPSVRGRKRFHTVTVHNKCTQTIDPSLLCL